ncbi:MAG: nuclease-related domain-containing protein [Dehalococcoidia bacterium]
MIRKEFTKIKANGKFSQAGVDAEKQMAFYLKRAFDDNPKVLVLNNIRLNWNDDPAQIDHLIIHKYGMVIIESKSVTNKVIINERGEWIRHYKHDQGMASPIKQAERQANSLRKYLDTCGPKLPGGFFSQPTYDDLPIDVVVAISNSGIIEPAKGLKLDNVCKADVVPDGVREIIEDHRQEGGLLGPFTLHEDTREAICTFLIRAHTPFEKGTAKRMEPKSPVAIQRQQTKESSFRCGKCQGKNIEILYGRSYYFKCRECDYNTPIKQICQSCEGKMRIRKDRNKFFAECQACGISNHIYTNP